MTRKPKSLPFDRWFTSLIGDPPHPWQAQLAESRVCQDRLLRIPTGLGKTAGTVLTWLYHRGHRGDLGWPTRLVFCLPMRVLVEQTERVIAGWLKKAGLHGEVGLHVLMGGEEAGDWAFYPERPAILVGTQDMLLSRALNRGFASGRGRWPVEMGLLSQDVLWVLDEVQLMDVGLATSAQLAAFRAVDAAQSASARPSHSWWMSATLQPDWLATIDHAASVPRLAEEMVRIPKRQRVGPVFQTRKGLQRERRCTSPADVAALARARHRPGSLTLVVANTVPRAIAIFEELKRTASPPSRRRRGQRSSNVRFGELEPSSPDLRLIHSRFRGAERALWAEDILRRDAPIPAGGRILIATQVVEAGVDLSASVLITDLAPWPSLVQRFGRAARYPGETAEIIVCGARFDAAAARPYSEQECAASERALDALGLGRGDASLRSLEELEERLQRERPRLLAELYPYAPEHVLRRKDFDSLFETTPDLDGADLDVSRFIRSGETRDALVFWRDIDRDVARRIPAESIGPVSRDELCPVPVSELRQHLSASNRIAFRFDYSEGEWVRLDASRVLPGMRVLLCGPEGGYDATGWNPKSRHPVVPVVRPEPHDEWSAKAVETAQSEEEDSLSRVPGGAWETISAHGRETSQMAASLAQALGLDSGLQRILSLAARWHDVGKAHPVFQAAISRAARERAGKAAARDLAKAPEDAWVRPPYPERPGFRHELASALALFELLRRTNPEHPALLGPHRELLEALDEEPAGVALEDRVDASHPLARELASLSAEEVDLVAWLVCAHHGKVRCGWTSTTRDQAKGQGAIHGVVAGDELPATALASNGAEHLLPPLRLRLEMAELGLSARYGSSWTERVAALLRRHGPFRLAFLEALLRAADVRASAKASIAEVAA